MSTRDARVTGPAPGGTPWRHAPAARWRWRVFAALDALLVAAFAVGFASGYLPFDTLWWTELVAIMLPYLNLLLVPAALVAALARRWGRLGLHLLLLLLFALRISAFERLLHDDTPREGDLVLLTYNAPGDAHTPAELAREGAGMKALAETLRPAVVCLQETNLLFDPTTHRPGAEPRVAVLLDTLGYQTRSPRPGTIAWTPQPVMSRVPVDTLTTSTLRFPTDDEDVSFTTRAVLSWQGRPFVLYNLHLQSFGERKPWRTPLSPFTPVFWTSFLRQYREAFQVRNWEVQQIRASLDRETLPVLVCGDLNSTPFNRAYVRLTRGLHDTFRTAGSGWGMTYHRRLPFARIDFVLASDDWAPVSAAPVDAALSDHLPFSARLRWR